MSVSMFSALRLIEVRAEAMQLAYERTDCGTAVVKCGPASKLKLACEKAKQFCTVEKGIENAECAIGSYLFPSRRIVSGHNEALKYLAEHKEKYNLISVKKHRLPGADHCNLMKSVVEPFTEVLKCMDIKTPIIAVHSNVDGQRYMSAEHIQQKLPKQIVSPVKWEQTMHIMYGRSQTVFPRSFSCGPGSQLMWLLKRNNAKAWDAAIRTTII